VFEGKTIKAIDKRLGKAGNIIAVRTVTGLKQIPEDTYKLQENDRLVVEVNLETLPKGKDFAEKIRRVVCRGKK
jgi:Trk K+ transport system NAD-binding subunit